MKIHLPIKTVSEANKSEHWTKRHIRARDQRQAIRFIIGQYVNRSLIDDRIAPLEVILCRVAPRFLDKGDNLSMSMKHVRDGIADALGIDDRDPRVEWQYDQRKGKPKEYAVEVEICSK